MTIEYRVKPITRFIVTRFEEKDDGGAATQIGTYDNGATAYEVGYALCRLEHIKSGEPEASINFVYPGIPQGVSVDPSA